MAASEFTPTTLNHEITVAHHQHVSVPQTKEVQEAVKEFVDTRIDDLHEILRENITTPVVITRDQFRRFEPMFKRPPEGLTKAQLAKYNEKIAPLTDEWRKLIHGDIYAFVHVIYSNQDRRVWLEIAPSPIQLSSIAATEQNCATMDSTFSDRMSKIPKHFSRGHNRVIGLFKESQMVRENLSRLLKLRHRVKDGAENFLIRKYGNNGLDPVRERIADKAPAPTPPPSVAAKEVRDAYAEAGESFD